MQALWRCLAAAVFVWGSPSFTLSRGSSFPSSVCSELGELHGPETIFSALDMADQRSPAALQSARLKLNNVAVLHSGVVSCW